MPNISFIGPTDQPTDNRRLLAELRACLRSGDFVLFRLVVAYAKSGPLIRLEDDLKAFRAAGGQIRSVVGIDQQGTSRQAIELAMTLMDDVYVTCEAGITFHPKIYVFEGPGRAVCFIGSNNLTVGGTETNFETAMVLDLALPAEQAQLQSVNALWDQLMPAACPATNLVDQAAFGAMVARGDLPDEMTMARRSRQGGGAGTGAGGGKKKSGLAVKPPSPLPKKALVQSTGNAAAAPPQPIAAAAAVAPPPQPALVHVSSAPAQRFAIQIKPKPNGEIFLSVTAALQNPAFFKWPFNGATTPKIPTNPSYPQLDPDPLVDIDVYGAAQTPILSRQAYALNTVYYARNSEIRVTASPLVGVVPPYSVMVWEPDPRAGIDYGIEIFTPASPHYAAWEAACNQQMPGGGHAPRKFGWF